MERRAPDPGPRAAWAFALVTLVLGVGFVVVILFQGSDRRLAAAPTATPQPTATATAAPSPTDALAVTGDGPGRPIPSPSAPPARATPAPAPTRDVASGAPRELRVEFPQDGETVVSRRINVFGRAGGGERIVRDLPDGGVADTVARPDGLWVMGVDLELGVNELAFRVEGTDGPTVVVRVTYQPR